MGAQADRKVLVIYTGGTIGMVQTDDGWAPGADLAGWLDTLVTRNLPGLEWGLRTIEPLIDSSNATPAEWQRIIDEIITSLDEYDAFVVLHGTDTLAHSAAAVHFALSGLDRAIVLTGAQRSLVVADSDAADNVLGALRCATCPDINEVAVFFDGRLLAAAHTTKVSSSNDHGFDSPNRPHLAVVTSDGRVDVLPDHRVATALTDSPALEDLKPYSSPDVVVVTLHPGLRASRLRAQLSPVPDAVVLRAYGSGNAPDNDPELLQVLTDVSEAGCVVIVTTQCPHGGVHLGSYAVSNGLLATGAVSGGDLPTDVLVVWLSHLLAQGLDAEAIREMIRSAHVTA